MAKVWVAIYSFIHTNFAFEIYVFSPRALVQYTLLASLLNYRVCALVTRTVLCNLQGQSMVRPGSGYNMGVAQK